MRALVSIVAAFLLFAAGCSGALPASAPIPDHQRWEGLYLRAPRLQVEIDALEGCVPPGAAVAALRRFLGEQCGSARAVEVRVDPPIARTAAAGIPPQRIALRHMRRDAPEDAARLYVLFFDGDLLGDALGDAAESGLTPRVFWSYPAAIFVDASYLRKAAERAPGLSWEDLAASIVVHEAGHALGLVRDRAHGDGAGHCSEDGCILRPGIELSLARQLFGGELPEPRICARCAADLAALRAAPADPRFRFIAAALLRREPLYSVVTLPGLTFVAFVEPAAIDARKLMEVADGVVAAGLKEAAAPIRTEAGGKWSPVQVSGYVATNLDDPAGRAALAPALAAALRDPDPHVRDGAERLERELRARAAAAPAPTPAKAR